MHGQYWDWWHGPWLGGSIFMVLFWIILILLAFYLIKGVFKKDLHHASALDILKKRYAAGEISKEEFEQMKKDIQA
jgi:putative membrane protein